MIAIADCYSGAGPTNTSGIVAFSTFDPKRTSLLSSSCSSPFTGPSFAVTPHDLGPLRATFCYPFALPLLLLSGQ